MGAGRSKQRRASEEASLAAPLLGEDECLGEDFELVEQEEDAAQDAIPEPRRSTPPPAARREEGLSLWRAAAAACLKAWAFLLSERTGLLPASVHCDWHSS